MRSCHYISEPGIGRILIPGCYGAAIYGKEGCTCGPRIRAKDEIANINERLARLEAWMAKKAAAK